MKARTGILLAQRVRATAWCYTVEGASKDRASGGRSIERAADRAQTN